MSIGENIVPHLHPQLKQVASAVVYIHAEGTVHGNITPVIFGLHQRLAA